MADAKLKNWPKAVVFDLDGTLVDSAPDIGLALNKLLEQDGLGPFSASEVRSFIGHGVKKLVERAYAARRMSLGSADLDDKVAVYQGLYKACIVVDTRPYPGALELVVTLRGQGIRTGICTNKTEVLTRALVDDMKLETLFDAVVAGSSKIKAKPAADMLLETLRQLGCTPDEAVMIGDSNSDVECARAAKVRMLGVTFGYTETPMRDLGPDAAIDHFDQALDAIAGLRDVA